MFKTAFEEHTENMLVASSVEPCYVEPWMYQAFTRRFFSIHHDFMAGESCRPELLKVCAPTGSGKTNVAMLTILNVMNQFRLKALRVENPTMRLWHIVA